MRERERESRKVAGDAMMVNQVFFEKGRRIKGNEDRSIVGNLKSQEALSFWSETHHLTTQTKNLN